MKCDFILFLFLILPCFLCNNFYKTGDQGGSPVFLFKKIKEDMLMKTNGQGLRKVTELCTTRRIHGELKFNQEMTLSFEESVKKMQMMQDLITRSGRFKDVTNRAEARKAIIACVKDEFDKLVFPNNRQKMLKTEMFIKRLYRLFRMVEHEVPYEKATMKTIDCFGVEVNVFPSGVRCHMKDGRKVIEVTQVTVGKPLVTTGGRSTTTATSTSMELYALLKYGETFLAAGETATIIASYTSLLKSGESSSKFELDYDASQHPCLTEEANADLLGVHEPNELDERFKPIFDEFAVGKMLSGSKECEHCHLCKFCNYERPAEYIPKVATKKSVKTLLAGLTPQQMEVVYNYKGGIARLLAGAGSGKTMVLALLIMRLVSEGKDLSKFLCITFTDIGAKEMKERLKAFLTDWNIPFKEEDMNIKTFNSFCFDEVKKHYQDLDFSMEPRLIDDADKIRAVRTYSQMYPLPSTDEYNSDSALSPYATEKVVSKAFDAIKKNGWSHGDEKLLCAEVAPLTESDANRILSMYSAYEKDMHDDCLIEFEDQLNLFNELLANDPYFIEKLGYEYIFVDEFQDTNVKQFDIIKNFIDTPSFKGLMVIGDPNQAIYGFNGTSPEFMLKLEGLLQEKVQNFILEDNFRSTEEIVTFSNKVLLNNAPLQTNEVDKTIPVYEARAGVAGGKKPIVMGCYTEWDEINYIAKNIEEMVQAGENPSDFYVMSHNKKFVLKVRDELAKRGIPGIFIANEPIANNARIQALISLERAMYDPASTLSIAHYLHVLHDGAFVNTCKNAGLSDEEVMEQVEAMKESLMKNMDGMSDDKKFEYFLELAKPLGFGPDEFFEKEFNRIKNLRGKDGRQTFTMVREELELLDRYGNNGKFLAKRTEDYQAGVQFTTCHGSKGTEKKHVFVSLSDFKNIAANEMSEARRLIYVACTRAKESLFITGQMITGGSKKAGYNRNIFLQECALISGKPLEVDTEAYLKRKKEAKKEAELLEAKRNESKEEQKISA